MVLRASNMARLVRRHVRSSSTVSSGLWLIMHGHVRIGMRRGRMWVVRLSIRGGWVVLGSGIGASSVVLTLAVVSTCGLRAVWNHLHSAGHGTSRTTTSRGIS